MAKVAQSLLDLRPAHAARKWSGSRALLLSSKDIISALKDEQVIVMACNTRIKHVIPGIMRAAEELDAVVAFELAKSECDVEGGYTGFVPATFAQAIMEAAEAMGFSRPFFIHGDHITIKDNTEKSIEAGRRLIAAEIEAGYTSFAIDASFNPIPDNIRITADLARPIVERGLGLEVEVGEIKSTGQQAQLTTVEEAVEFVTGLRDHDIAADLLAINNGSKHGNYLAGEEISIDLERTGRIYQAIRGSFGMVLAQHGVTGTPMHLLGRFADHGIRKANVGTQWQNIAHQGLPADLMKDMRAWAAEKGKDIKLATREFRDRIDTIDEASRLRIEQAAREEARRFIMAFRAEGTGSAVMEVLARR
ncbi:MAG: class II fructose-bisphosphate aldolase [Pseudomonadota bacterium]